MNTAPEKRQPEELRHHLYGASFCIIAARFNAEIVEALKLGARTALLRNGIVDSAIHCLAVPGAFEVPLAAQQAARSGRYDGIVALAAVIRGGTPHFEYVSAQAIGGLGKVSLDCGIPIGNGILTVDTVQQAVDRAGGTEGNKGEEAALAALEMVHLLRELGV